MMFVQAKPLPHTTLDSVPFNSVPESLRYDEAQTVVVQPVY